jgi:hypothetical protein
MRAECAATTALACGAEHVPSFLPVCHLLVLFLRKQTVPRRSGCKGEVGIVPSLRPAEIWGEDDVSLKRRYITVSRVAHVTGSVWQRLLGARAHDMIRCHLTLRLVLAAGCSSCHATSVLRADVCSCVMECSSSSNRQRNAPRAVEPGTSLMAQHRTLFFAHDKIAQQSKSAQRWRVGCE